MATKNQTIGARGTDITLDVYFYAYDGGSLVDSIPDPTYIIKDPLGATVDSGTGTKISTGTYQAVYSIPIGATLSSDWSIEWSATINGSPVTDSEFFIVVESGEIGFGGDVQISDSWLEQIKKVLAFPEIDEVLLTDEQIKSYCVFPALYDYFSKFPIEETYEASITKQSIVDFPDDNTFGVLHVAVVDTGLNQGSSDSFWDIVRLNTMGGISGINSGVYGKSNYNPSGLLESKLMEMDMYRSVQDKYNTTKFRIDTDNKKVYAFSSVTGTLNIVWAKYSLNFEDVYFSRKFDVIQLCQAYLLDHLADATSIYSDSDTSLDINSSDLRSRAEDLKTKVNEKWIEYTDVVLLNI